MRMMDELKPLFLYSAKNKVYAPIDEKDRRKNAAILMLTPSLESSSSLMKLPYIYNPNLFTSFYIDRNVMAYIDDIGIENIEFDEQEEETLSEAVQRNTNTKIKFKFDDNISMMDKITIEEVFNNKTAQIYIKQLRLKFVPETIKIISHPNLATLRKSAPSKIENMYKEKMYSYTNGNEIHVISKLVFDPTLMGGTYQAYLLTELLYCLISLYNPDLPFIPVRGISLALSGQTKLMENNQEAEITEEDKFAKSIVKIIDRGRIDTIIKYINDGDLSIFIKYITGNAVRKLSKLIFESQLSYFERQRLLPSDFGIPDKRKYPMPDEEHVRAAIRLFNNCDPSDEEELAKDIIRRIKRFGITDVKVSASNRFRKYYSNYLNKEGKGNKINESFVNSDYEDIMKICSHLSDDELKLITFYDTYRDSQFVIKRIIHRVGPDPAGFLDVYLFPSKPDIAQIVIAVDNRYRGQGIAKDMVMELMASNLPETHNFKYYYWTAHTFNKYSQNLALNNGFIDTGKMDKYGRLVYIKPIIKSNENWNSIPDCLKPTVQYESFVSSDSSFVTENMAVFFEADDPNYSQKLKRYLYSERLKNNKGVLQLYERVREYNPEIKKMYVRIEMYKKFNVFIDLSYYHSLFLKNNIYKADKAVNFYFDFINRLINNKEISSEYKKQTIFIPIDSGTWPVVPKTEIYDFRKNLNPISIIFRLIRTNPAALKKEWGNKDIIFVGSRGYFKVDFKTLELRDLTRFKTNLRKLMSEAEPIVDDYEMDTLEPDEDSGDEISKTNSDSSKAMTIKMIDKVEKATSIKVNDVSSANTNKPVEHVEVTDHLKISSKPIDLGIDQPKNGVAIITIDPDGPEGFEKLSKSVLSNFKTIDTYLVV